MNNNVLLINKPAGPTSHDIVDKVREITNERRVGHAGTLDPFAEGLLIVLVGRAATKRQSEFMKLDKEYIATLRLGAETDTQDTTGEFLPFSGDRVKMVKRKMTKEYIAEILKKFVGTIRQVPPAYSAIKINGKRAYQLARKGEIVELKARKIKIYKIKVLKYKWPLLEIKVECSSGTYIRSLARDVGKQLGCGAYLEALKRTKIGAYSINDAVSLIEIERVYGK